MRRFQFNDVSFEAPSEWMDLSIITLAGSDSSTFQPNIVITREDAPASLEAYAKAQIADVKRQVKSHQLISGKLEKVAGNDGYMLEHKMTTPEGHAVRQLQYFAKAGKDVVVVSLTCAEKELSVRRKTLTSIVESLRFD